jgi:AraC-like DNA-binding protein
MTERVRLPSALVVATLAYARAQRPGPDLDAIAARFGVGDVSKAGAPVIGAGNARQLLDAVAVAIGDPMLGIHVAQSVERGAYGVVEFAARSAPTLRSSLERVVRFIALVSAPAVAELAPRSDGSALLRFRFPGVQGTLGRHGNEFFAAYIWLRAQELTGTKFTPTQIAFEHAAPRHRRELEDFFGTTNLAFSTPWNDLGIDASSLQLSILSHEPHLLPLLDKMAEDEIRSRGDGTLVDHVAREIRTLLAKGEPSLDEVARAVGMSGRTLQRRLNEEGAPFADLVDDVRKELALIHVRDVARSLDDVAGLLGYAGSRPFQRAFKRWTGMTPLEYRRASEESEESN